MTDKHRLLPAERHEHAVWYCNIYYYVFVQPTTPDLYRVHQLTDY